MRAIIGAVVAVGVGFILGALATTYLGITKPSSQKEEAQKAAEAETSAYFLCSTHISDTLKDPESPLIIKTVRNIATSIVWSWKSTADVFDIEETNDLHYIAYEREPDAKEAYTKLDLNRVTGELLISNKLSDDVRGLIASICEGRVPKSQCESRLTGLRGTTSTSCWVVTDETTCSRVKNTGVPIVFAKSCRPASRPF